MMHAAILRELMIAGYEGVALLAAFERMCVIIAPGETVPRAALQQQSPVRAKRTQPDIPVAPYEPAPPPANAKSIATKAIAQAAISGAAKTIASHLMEHFNLRTGRCDPGQTRLAQKAGIDVRSVRRVIDDHLVASGLFVVVRHGGHGHRNAYLPCWPELIRLAALGENGSGQKSPAEQDENVRQNLLRKPDSDSMVGRASRGKRSAAPDRRQMTMVMPITGGRGKAEEAVRAKLNRQMQAHFTAVHIPDDRPAFVRDMTASTSANWEAAIAAEMAKAGGGLPLLLADIGRIATSRKAAG
jgi:hypothetical protein